MIALWMVLAAMALVFVIASKLLLVRALFATNALQWAKHRKTAIKQEALWVWRTALLAVLVIGVAEYLKAGMPLTAGVVGGLMIFGIVLLAAGMYVWLAAMAARKQFLWYFQVLSPKEQLPPYSTNGIYATVRNPRELGFVLVLAGLVAVLGLKFTLPFVIMFLFATMYRASSRDRIMMEQYGKAYVGYASRSKKLIPYLY
jgi:protein-S-isoprenylcysteine O-methyltransferase Ste14